MFSVLFNRQHSVVFTVFILCTFFTQAWQETIITWDTSETWLEFYIKYCGRVCINGSLQKINTSTCEYPACFKCDCGSSCSIYGTCCPSLNSTKDVDNQLNSTKDVDYKKINLFEISDKPLFENLPSEDRFRCDPLAGTSQNLYMISDCPPEYIRFSEQHKSLAESMMSSLVKDFQATTNVVSLCNASKTETFDGITPYLDLHYGITFKNKFCAICNGYNIIDANNSGLSESRVENVAATWQIAARCSHFQNLYQATTELELFKTTVEKGLRECTIEYKPPHSLMSAKQCDPEMNRMVDAQCSSSDSKLRDNCLTLKQKYLRVKGGENMFCHICNKGPLSSQMCDPNQSAIRTEVAYSYTPFSLLLGTTYFDLHLSSSGDSNLSDDFKCNSSNEWLNNKGVCEAVICSTGKRVDKEGLCRSPLTQIRGLGYKLFMILVPKSLNMCVSVTDIRFMRDIIYDRLLALSQAAELETNLTVLPSSHDNGEEVVLETVSIFAHIIGSKEVGRDLFEKEVLHLVNSEWTIDLLKYHNYTLTLVPTILGTEFAPLIHHNLSETVTESIKIPSELGLRSLLPIEVRRSMIRTYISQSLLTDDLISVTNTLVKRYRMCIWLDQTDSLEWEFKDKFIDITGSLTCPFVAVNVTNIWLKENTIFISFPFNRRNITVTSALNVSVVNGELRICIDLFRHLTRDVLSTEHDMIVLVTYYLEFICVFLSVVCLLMSLTTYCIFPSLRTLPGLNNMSLCLSLATAQVLLLITAEFGIHEELNPGYCYFHAIALHYSWLASFLWMSACCIHMYRVFTARSTKFINTSSDLKRYLQYCLYAFGSPVIIIVLLIVISLRTSGDSTGYSSRLCFFDIQMSLLTVILSLIGPLCFTILTNAVLFFLTVREMVHVSRLQVRNRNGQSVVTYTKLSTLTGIFYIVGGVAIQLQNPVLDLLTMPIMGLQGVFIFMSFTFNKRVGKLYSELLRCSPEFTQTDYRNKRTVDSSDISSGRKQAKSGTESSRV